MASASTATATAAAAAAAATAFSAGDVVVYRLGDGTATLSGSGAPVFLDEYSPTGTLLSSVALPTAAAGADKPIVGSGSASSEGGLTLSADGRYLVATGYDAAVGASGLSSSAAASVPRTIARVDGSGNVDTSTALTDFADGNNPRSAVSADGSEFWVGGAAGGVRYAPLGASTSTSLVASTFKNVRQLSIVDGQLYTSADPTKANVTVATVGSGLPTSGTNAVTDLPFASAGSAPVEPYAYSLLTLRSGTTPDTLYVADDSLGAVVKYGLSGGVWTQQGSVAVPNVTGLTANDAGGTVTVYASSSGANGTTGELYKITDSSGIGGTLSGAASVIAIAPSDEAFRGVAFAPGTVTGSGGGTAPTNPAPSISTAYSGLPAALGDPTNPTLGVSVGDANPAFTADQLSVTATSSNTAVAPESGISLTGSGADRTLTVTPGAVGYSTITLTVTAPDGTSAVTEVQYGVSANLGDPTQRYFSGAGNGSTAVDVGDGYMIVGDDESNVLRLYDETESGPPVRSFDFTSVLPFGTTEVDIESSARSGDMLYWTGSMSNNDDGSLEPSRSTLFAARITGSGADTQLTYVGSYTGLQSDLVSWDEDNGSGLGANYFGFDSSVQTGVSGHEDDALNVEGMEFAGGSSTTAYLAFRAPLEPTADRHLALLVPVTDIDQLVQNGNPGTVHATFGAPILMDLGGLGVREIRENADGQYLIIAGTADDANSSFVLYSWDGKPSDPPLQTGTTLPLEPSGANQGSWETIVAVPDPLTAGTQVQLLQDNGDTAWYGDTLTSKAGLAPALQKDLGQVFTYAPGTPIVTTTTVAAQPTAPTAGETVTYTATVAGPAGGLGTPTGTVEFVSGGGGGSGGGSAGGVGGSGGAGTGGAGTGGADVGGCSAQPVNASGIATCTTTYSAAGSQTVSADYSGDGSYAASSSSSTLTVFAAPVTVNLGASTTAAVTGQSVTFTATVSGGPGIPLTPTGTIEFQADGTDLPGCSAVPLAEAQGGIQAQCVVPAGFAPSTQSVVALYSGDPAFAAEHGGPVAVTVTQDSTSVTVSSSANPVPYNGNVTLDAQVAAAAPGSGTPTGSVTFTVVPAAGGKSVPLVCAGGGASGSGSVPLSAGIAQCVVNAQSFAKPGGTYTISAAYSGDGGFDASSAVFTQKVALVPSTTTLSVLPSTTTAQGSFTVAQGSAVLITVGVSPAGLPYPLLSGQVSVTVVNAHGVAVPCVGIMLPGLGGLCAILPGQLTAAQGPYRVTAGFAGNAVLAPSSASGTITVTAPKR